MIIDVKVTMKFNIAVGTTSRICAIAGGNKRDEAAIPRPGGFGFDAGQIGKLLQVATIRPHRVNVVLTARAVIGVISLDDSRCAAGEWMGVVHYTG